MSSGIHYLGAVCADVEIRVGSLRCFCVYNRTHGNESLDTNCPGTDHGSQYTNSAD